MPADSYSTSLRIEAPPEVVFECFCDPRAMLTWMGERAELDPRPGGLFLLDVGPFRVRGRYVVVERPSRLVFSWGFDETPDFPEGSSTVEVSLTPEGTATQLTLVHSGLPAAEAPKHGQGWTKYLPRLAAAARYAQGIPR
ncbi:MAG: SRPBCC domain-containing protein [Chloroflexi bacterium]|nr:SRPBCC domain-containing protein [Chloroflexota bacterium]